MLSWFSRGSGSIIMACGNERPLRTRNSRQLSNLAESLPSSWMMGKSLCTSSPNRRIGIAKGLSAWSTAAPPACDTLPWVVHARAQRGTATLCGHPGARAGAAQHGSCWGCTRAVDRAGEDREPGDVRGMLGKRRLGRRPGLYSTCRVTAGVKSTGLEGQQS